jgi:exosome complex component RRP45
LRPQWTGGMQRVPPSLSKAESSFILQAIGDGLRVDGRRPLEPRELSVAFGAEPGSVQVRLGDTKVLAVASAELIEPYADRPTEGMLQLFVELSAMAAPHFEPGRPSEAAVELMRMLERALRKSQAIDVEALCLVAGKHVWAVRCDVTVLDHCGGLTDACLFAALLALKHLRLPPVEVTGVGDQASAKVLPLEQGETTPLVFHHTPIAVSVALFRSTDGAALLHAVDPSEAEELVSLGLMTIVVNQAQELCALSKPGGLPVEGAQLLECVRDAATVVPKRLATLDAVLSAHAAQLAAAAEVLRRTGRTEKKRKLEAAALPSVEAMAPAPAARKETAPSTVLSSTTSAETAAQPPEARASKKKKKKKKSAGGGVATSHTQDSDEEETVTVRSAFDEETPT